MSRTQNSPTLLRDLSDRLRALGDRPETPAAREEVEAALASKWWSLRAVAIRVLGRWGGKADKAWLIERALRAESGMAGGVYRHAVRQGLRDFEAQTAAEALRPHLGPQDADWLLDRWFSDEATAGALHGHIMTQMVFEPIERRVAEELAKKRSEQRRLPLFWLVRLRAGLTDREDIMRRLATGQDEAGEEARRFLEWEARTAEAHAAAKSAAKAVPKKVAARRAAAAEADAADREARRQAGKKGRR